MKYHHYNFLYFFKHSFCCCCSLNIIIIATLKSCLLRWFSRPLKKHFLVLFSPCIWVILFWGCFAYLIIFLVKLHFRKYIVASLGIDSSEFSHYYCLLDGLFVQCIGLSHFLIKCASALFISYIFTLYYWMWVWLDGCYYNSGVFMVFILWLGKDWKFGGFVSEHSERVQPWARTVFETATGNILSKRRAKQGILSLCFSQ